jgi:hypothetical protein
MTDPTSDGRDDFILQERLAGRSARSIGKELRCTVGEVDAALDRLRSRKFQNRQYPFPGSSGLRGLEFIVVERSELLPATRLCLADAEIGELMVDLRRHGPLSGTMFSRSHLPLPGFLGAVIARAASHDPSVAR